MKNDKRRYDIKLFDLEEGHNRFRYRLDQSFFDAFGPMEFEDAQMDMDLDITKRGHLMEVEIKGKGSVQLPDDRTGEPYRQPLEGSLSFVLKYGHEYNDDNIDMITIPYQTPTFNMAQSMYELTLLSIPMKRLDPARAGQTDEGEREEPAEQPIDPRWEKLKQLKNNKTE